MLNVTDHYCISPATSKGGFPVIRVICHESVIYVTGHVSHRSEAQGLLPRIARQSETFFPPFPHVSREGFSAAQRCNIFDKMVFVQVISVLLHFALIYFHFKILFHFAPVFLQFEIKSCYILGKKLLQFPFTCVKSYNAA